MQYEQTSIFGGVDVVDGESGLIGRKRKQTLPNGYAGIPGEGLEGETCGTCRHHIVKTLSKRYHKCALLGDNLTNGVGTDIRVRSPACGFWEPKLNGK